LLLPLLLPPPLPLLLLPPPLLLLLLQVATLMSRVSALEAQNSQLRVAAAKREQVLQQSRKFIEGHLARWSPGSAGGAAAAAAGGGQPGGATNNGVGQANGTRGPPGKQ
jgi:hypothetical protein